jgi:hypothetical protein
MIRIQEYKIRNVFARVKKREDRLHTNRNIYKNRTKRMWNIGRYLCGVQH